MKFGQRQEFKVKIKFTSKSMRFFAEHFLNELGNDSKSCVIFINLGFDSS